MVEARNALKISQPTLYKLIHAGKLPTYKIGRRRFTTTNAIADLMAALQGGNNERV
jgi:predicted site-specific integrase-resolvase